MTVRAGPATWPPRLADDQGVPPPWRAAAACRDSDPALFYPVGSPETTGAQVEAARSICAGCPVRLTCLEAGRDERYGIWGGTTEEERREWRRARRGPPGRTAADIDLRAG